MRKIKIFFFFTKALKERVKLLATSVLPWFSLSGFHLVINGSVWEAIEGNVEDSSVLHSSVSGGVQSGLER